MASCRQPVRATRASFTREDTVSREMPQDRKYEASFQYVFSLGTSSRNIHPHAHHRVIVVHQQIGVLLQHALRQPAGDGDDDRIVAAAPGIAEAGAHRLAAEDFQPAAAFDVLAELAQ